MHSSRITTARAFCCLSFDHQANTQVNASKLPAIGQLQHCCCFSPIRGHKDNNPKQFSSHFISHWFCGILLIYAYIHTYICIHLFKNVHYIYICVYICIHLERSLWRMNAGIYRFACIASDLLNSGLEDVSWLFCEHKLIIFVWIMRTLNYFTGRTGHLPRIFITNANAWTHTLRVHSLTGALLKVPLIRTLPATIMWTQSFQTLHHDVNSLICNKQRERDTSMLFCRMCNVPHVERIKWVHTASSCTAAPGTLARIIMMAKVKAG